MSAPLMLLGGAVSVRQSFVTALLRFFSCYRTAYCCSRTTCQFAVSISPSPCAGALYNCEHFISISVRMSSKKYASGSEKRKKKRQEEEKLSKLPKMAEYFSPVTTRDKTAKSEICEETKNTSKEVGVIGTSNQQACSSNNVPNSDKCVDEVSKSHEETAANRFDFNLEYVEGSCKMDKANFKEVNDQVRRFVIENGHCKPKGPFDKDNNGKSFSERYYCTTSKSGLRIERTWLCYSQILKKAYCEPCWLFGDRTSKKLQSVWIDGYCDWKHVHEAIRTHESSKTHLDSCLIYEQWRLHGTLDEELESIIKKQKLFWRQVLHILLNVALTLAMCNLPFRGHREKVGSQEGGSRNFISIIELLANYDPVLREVLNKPKGQIKYMSPSIQNELINILSVKVESKIVKEIKEAPFYSIVMDTTQDISKRNQLSEIYRYCVIQKDENGTPRAMEIKESFLGFHVVEDQSALCLSNEIIKEIQKRGFSLTKCRGQGYDGASNMSGVYNGVQKRIRNIEPNAIYVHCAAHNLNLVVNDAVAEVEEMRNFFYIVQRLYVFFGLSIKRWNILSSLLSSADDQNVTLKKVNPTRWAGRYDAIFALTVRFRDIQKALCKIILLSSKSDEKNEAEALKKHTENYNFVCLAIFQRKILQKINVVSNAFQLKNMDLSKAVALLQRCLEEIKNYRNCFEKLRKEANGVANGWSIRPEFLHSRHRKVRRHYDELCQDGRLRDPDSFFRVNVFFRTLDIITSQIQCRFSGLSEVVSNFSVLQPKSLQNLSDIDLLHKAEEFADTYSKDISPAFSREILSMRSALSDDISKVTTISELASLLIVKNHFLSSSFPEVCTALMLFLTIPVTTASAERSFSKLKIIKNYLRSTMGQERLKSLALLSIEQSVARKLDFEEVIDNFAEIKARKMEF